MDEIFDRNSEIDVEKGYTSAGFHRADLRLYKGKPAKETCSGELKALVWALKLARAEFLAKKGAKENKQFFWLMISEPSSMAGI